ncbi:MAG: tetratricopeptide repeat protein [Planctomycetes bacterium]|nr:tetratricopeptide repeat protein [Planctomycetota bacterium]
MRENSEMGYVWYDAIKHVVSPSETRLSGDARRGDEARADEACGEAAALARAWGGDTECLLRAARLACHALDLDPSCGFAYGLIGLIWLSAGREAGDETQHVALWEAERWVRRAERVGPAEDSDVRECVAEFLMLAGRHDEAMEEIEALRAALPAGHPDPAWLACRLHAHAGDEERAVRAGRQARAAMTNPAKRLTLLNTLGVALSRLGRYEEADEVFRELVDLGPDYLWGWHNWAVALAAAGRLSEALAACDHALAFRAHAPTEYLRKEIKRMTRESRPAPLTPEELRALW